MKERVTLNTKEQRRLMMLEKVLEGDVTGPQAAGALGVSLRHERRLMAAFRKDGAAGLAHGNRGVKPGHALREELKQQLVTIAKERYLGCNHQHLTELLKEREGIILSRSTVRRVMLGAGLGSPRTRRPPRHRSRRPRYPQAGMLLQTDGSHHDWLEGRGPWLTLVAAIDDATGEVPAGLFRPEEDAIGYFQMLKEVVDKRGIPQALYHDRGSVFVISQPRQERGIERPSEHQLTQFGRLLGELGITSWISYSAQSRGRIERFWKTCQDRLVSELRLAGAATLEEANRVLQAFLVSFNQQFVLAPAQPGCAYRRLSGPNLADCFCFKHERTVGADNVVRYESRRLQILPPNGRRSYGGAKVEVREGLDGQVSVYYQGLLLPSQPAPLEASLLRGGQPNTPAPNHPWRRWVSHRGVTESQNTKG